eukprot:Seg918.6 transcript_id=Seg918.6/GoldUCD/mRNA.D3Y31 product="EKC/KEOPS complex subunit TPRKB" protein_id=Seg918.6/GoldUCD/D3Y31
MAAEPNYGGSLEIFDLGDKCDFKVKLKLFKDVKNVAEMKENLIKGDMQATLLRPNLVSGSFAVIVAANKAAKMLELGKMKTKNVHTELLLNMSPTTSISGALKMFGIQDNDKELLMACIFKKEEEEQVEKYFGAVEGTPCKLQEMENFSNEEELKKLYKITNEELEIGTVSDAIVCRIATKDAS